MNCRKCGRGANEIGGILIRVNPKGVAGIFECSPSCSAALTPEEKIKLAITGEEK